MKFTLCTFVLVFTLGCATRRSAAPTPAAATVTDETALPQIAPREALAAIEAGSLLLDVREPAELVAMRYDVPTQLDIPLGDLLQRIEEVPRDRPVIVACGSGGRSTRAIEQLQEAGYTNLINLTGGMRAWEAAGLPVAKGEGGN